MRIKTIQVDAFSAVPFKGNPAAVCLPDTALSDELMQAIAAENNLAETAFVVPVEECFSLRWFTPEVEVPLCGHATLASAHVLWQEGLLAPDQAASFHTASGLLTVTKQGDWLELNFPAFPNDEIELPEEIFEALGLTKKPKRAVWTQEKYLLEVASEEELAQLDPDFGVLEHFPAVMVTARATADSGYDFVSRFFAPSLGVDEDPVTGSAHCSLAVYWAEKLGKNDLRAYQASVRGGELRITVEGKRVKLRGQAITVLEGTLILPDA